MDRIPPHTSLRRLDYGHEDGFSPGHDPWILRPPPLPHPPRTQFSFRRESYIFFFSSRLLFVFLVYPLFVTFLSKTREEDELSCFKFPYMLFP